MPGPLIDCYVIQRQRSLGGALGLLRAFGGKWNPRFDFAEICEKHQLPLTSTVEFMIEELSKDNGKTETLYFANANDLPPYCLIYSFNPDGSVVYGLSPVVDREGQDYENIGREWVNQLVQFVGNGLFLVTVEEAPPGSYSEFMLRTEK